MKIEIMPYVGAGPVRFGMSTEEVRRALGMEFTVFKKSPTSLFPTDAFRSAGIHVCYDAAGKCEALEFWGPSCPTFASIDLLRTPTASTMAQFRQIDPGLEVDASGYTSIDQGISVYAPGHLEEPDIMPESVLAFRRGYYES